MYPILLLLMLLSAASAEAQTFFGDAVVLGTKTPSGSPLTVVGLPGTSGATILRIDTSGTVARSLLVPPDIPSQFPRRDLNEAVPGLWTFENSLGVGTTLSVGTNLSVGGTLGVGGASALHETHIIGSATIDTTLDVTGQTTLRSVVDLPGTASLVNSTGQLLINDAARVAGFLTLDSSIAVNGGQITSTASELQISPTGDLRVNSTGAFRVSPVGGYVVQTDQIMDTNTNIRTDNWSSSVTGWRIGYRGDSDFRSMFSNEMKAQSFTTDITQATNGDLLVTKSTATLAAPFSCPLGGAFTSLVVDDYSGALNVRAFSPNDFVTLQGGGRTDPDGDGMSSLDLTLCIGQVTEYADGPEEGQQTWKFTRVTGPNGGIMTGGTTVAIRSPVIDYGTPSNGIIRMTANDGSEGLLAPYINIATWNTSPSVLNWTTHVRFGNLRGITDAIDEYGVVAGTYSSTNGRYFRASNQQFELHGIDLTMWDSLNQVIKLSRLGPSLAIGSSANLMLYGSGPGVWMGKDLSDNIYKFRVGTPGGPQMTWNSNTGILNVAGTITVTAPSNILTNDSNTSANWAGSTARGGSANDTAAVNGLAAATVSTGATLANTGLNSSGDVRRSIHGADFVANSPATGLNMTSTQMGYYNPAYTAVGGWPVRISSNGTFFFGSPDGSKYVSWDNATLTVHGTLDASDITTGILTGRTIRSNLGITWGPNPANPTGGNGFILDAGGPSGEGRLNVGAPYPGSYLRYDGSSLSIRSNSFALFGSNKAQLYMPGFDIQYGGEFDLYNSSTSGTMRFGAAQGTLVLGSYFSSSNDSVNNITGTRLGDYNHRWRNIWLQLPGTATTGTTVPYVVVGNPDEVGLPGGVRSLGYYANGITNAVIGGCTLYFSNGLLIDKAGC